MEVEMILKKKKKGSTLIELIGAISILMIGLSAITVSFSTSSKIWQNHNKKLDNSTFNQTICQNLRQKDKWGIRDIYNTITGSNGKSEIYIYFNSYEELVGTGNLIDTDKVRLGAIGYETGYLDIDETSYQKCKDNNSGTKKYGALITIEDKRVSGDYFPLFQIKVVVWNLEDAGKYEATSSFYIGG